MDFDYRLPIQYGSTQPKIALIHSDEIALSKSAKLNKRESPVPVKSLAQCSSINVDYQVTLLLKQHSRTSIISQQWHFFGYHGIHVIYSRFFVVSPLKSRSRWRRCRIQHQPLKVHFPNTSVIIREKLVFAPLYPESLCKVRQNEQHTIFENDQPWSKAEVTN